ncbi:hypothetical protein [Caballeronia sp. dw_19]|uniref:hypothetical protein n=1 Tax=Caballeronia sp. dw_19 TaxID=2719791 RepID=UPI001BD25072|nr:hypothetical protein [Caballeronia sp. dw_19]
MFSAIVAITLCAAVWLLLQSGRRKVYGAVLGLFNSMLWIFAGLTAGTHFVALIAAVCGLNFLVFLAAAASTSTRRSHAH